MKHAERDRFEVKLGRVLALLPLVGIAVGCSPDRIVGRDQTAAAGSFAVGGKTSTSPIQAGGSTRVGTVVQVEELGGSGGVTATLLTDSGGVVGSVAGGMNASAPGGSSSKTTGNSSVVQVTSGGTVSTGGAPSTGGKSVAVTQNTSLAGSGNSATLATGGAGTGGAVTGGAASTGGAATGGVQATGGAAAAGASSTLPPVCDSVPNMPRDGTVHTGNSQGGKDNLAWQLWSNTGAGSLTTFSSPAFIASWNNSGDYLARIGLDFANGGKPYAAYGTITADYAFMKTGSGGAYSYIGIYGWSTNPCVEWYIVEDSFNAMPIEVGAAPSGIVHIDGGTYNQVTRSVTATGGSRCGGVSKWTQYYSIRTQGRQCGTVSISEHFDVWKARGWNVGNLLEAKILVETSGGQGSVEFPLAYVTTTQ